MLLLVFTNVNTESERPSLRLPLLARGGSLPDATITRCCQGAHVRLAPANGFCRAARAREGREAGLSFIYDPPSPEVQASDPHSISQFLCQKFDLTFDQRDSTHPRSSILTPAAMKCMSPSSSPLCRAHNAKVFLARTRS